MTSCRGSTVVITLGVILLAGAVGHHAGEARKIASRAGPTIALLLDGGLASVLIGGGWWLRQTDLTVSEERSVALWTVVGSVTGLGIAGMIALVRALEARPIVEFEFSVLVHTASVAASLFIAGTYASRRRAVANRFETLFNNTTHFAGLLQPDGTVVTVNRSTLEFGGLDQSDVVGRQLQDISWWTHSETVNERLQETLCRAADGETVRYETVVRAASGLRAIDFCVRPVVDKSGETTKIVAEGLDITEKQRQRQHLQVLHRVMRHNMRNDLMKLRGWTQIAATASTHGDRVAAADRVTSVLDSWEKMTEDIKQIQSAVQPKPELIDTTPDATPVADVVDAQRDAYSEAVFEVRGATSSNVHVPAAVREAMTEAIDNAVNSTTTDTAQIRVTVERIGDGWLGIEIADNGPGIPEAEATLLETGEETALNHGNNLGVWKIRMLIKQIGGDISVDSEPDGTTLRFKLPEEPARQTAPAA